RLCPLFSRLSSPLVSACWLSLPLYLVLTFQQSSHTYSLIKAHIYTDIHTHTHTPQSHTHTHTHRHTHTHPHKHPRTHTHSYTHTHTLSLSLLMQLFSGRINPVF